MLYQLKLLLKGATSSVALSMIWDFAATAKVQKHTIESKENVTRKIISLIKEMKQQG